MRLFIEQLWSASREGFTLTRRALLFWYVLKIVSYFYALGFYVRQQLRRRISSPRAPFNIPVIAVGNLSMGGTGKSVFVDWLVRHTDFKHPAVLLRGYRSPVLRNQQTFIVSDGQAIFGEAVLVGDEAAQIAARGIAVAIGKNRYKALMALLGMLKGVSGENQSRLSKLLSLFSMGSSKRRLSPSLRLDDSGGQHGTENFEVGFEKNFSPPIPDVVILDDGYQTTTIYKDCSILLVDARAPFENGYLFPAGPLREKDYSRADIIVLTHADQAKLPLNDLKKKYFPDILSGSITAGRHAFEAFINSEGDVVTVQPGTPVSLCSGIAKPQNLEQTVRQQNLSIVQHMIFFDHHDYASEDVQSIIARCKQHKSSILITTEKDWTKLRMFHAEFMAAEISCLIAKITFEFLTPREYAVFVMQLRKVLAESRVAT